MLTIEIGGLNPGTEHDLLDVQGDINLLGGTLNIVQWDDFNPQYGNSFTILSFASLNGTFDTINAFGLDSGLAWDFSSLYSSGTLWVIPEPSSALLLLLSAATLGLLRRGRRATA